MSMLIQLQAARPAPEQPGLPGYNLPANYLPKFNVRAGYWVPQTAPLFPTGFEFSPDSAKVHREILMMRAMNNITDEKDWDTKVFDERVISKWRDQMVASGQDISPAMKDFIIHELQWKALRSKADGLITAFDMGVVKSDEAIQEALKQALKSAVASLENVPEDQKTYEPESDERVLDLVDPSLFPLVYGKSRILPDQLIDIKDTFKFTGEGEVIPKPKFTDYDVSTGESGGDTDHYSKKFQWLPCDVKLAPMEKGERPRIMSYINNLHPKKHRDLYDTIEKVIQQTIPLWNRTLNGVISMQPPRIPYNTVKLEHDNIRKRPESLEGVGGFHQEWRDWADSLPITQPEPGPFQADSLEPPDCVDLHNLFGNTGLQIIVKMANIELTPETPTYNGGSWHLQGQLNDRIVATAMYYYDCENVTDATVSFRQRMYRQPLINSLNWIWSALDPMVPESIFYKMYGMFYTVKNTCRGLTQEIGDLVCREGRLITFPNTLLSHVSPLSLCDESKPGHCKILTLLLIDPHLKIISTANIPPQQTEWEEEKVELVSEILSVKLPTELHTMIYEAADWHPTMGLEEAKQLRLKLTKQQKANYDLLQQRPRGTTCF